MWCLIWMRAHRLPNSTSVLLRSYPPLELLKFISRFTNHFNLSYRHDKRGSYGKVWDPRMHGLLLRLDAILLFIKDRDQGKYVPQLLHVAKYLIKTLTSTEFMSAAKTTFLIDLAWFLFWRRNIGRGFVDRAVDSAKKKEFLKIMLIN